MAELNTSAPKAGGARGAKRKSTRVDLTAMVDLAFLLITFFMLTTTLSKPHAMAVAMPDKTDPIDHTDLPASRTMTICLGTNNKAVYFVGLPDENSVIKPTVVDYSKSGLRHAILEAKAKVRSQSGKDMMVVIKPSDHSVYNDTVDALDEMNITNIERYAIVDTQPQDVALLKSKGIY